MPVSLAHDAAPPERRHASSRGEQVVFPSVESADGPPSLKTLPKF